MRSAFAIVSEGKVKSFITEESQKADLLVADPTLEFYPFEWDLERLFYPSDFSFENGKLIKKEITE